MNWNKNRGIPVHKKRRLEEKIGTHRGDPVLASQTLRLRFLLLLLSILRGGCTCVEMEPFVLLALFFPVL